MHDPLYMACRFSIKSFFYAITVRQHWTLRSCEIWQPFIIELLLLLFCCCVAVVVVAASAANCLIFVVFVVFLFLFC